MTKSKKQLDARLKKVIIKQYECNNISPYSLSKMYGVSKTAIYSWIHKKRNKSKLDRKNGSGKKPKISGETALALQKYIKHPASKYGFENDLWDLSKIALICKKNLNINVSRMSIWRTLKTLNFSCKKVQRKYIEANKSKQKTFIKQTIEEIKEDVKTYNAVLYFLDESNVSLASNLGKSWSKIGKKISVKGTGKRGSVGVISAINNRGKLLFRTSKGLKRTRSKDVIQFLKSMQNLHTKKRKLIIVMDNARVHTSKEFKKFVESQKNLKVYYLPPYSPEFNPDEKVFNHLKNIELKNHKAENLDEFEKLVSSKMRKIAANKHTVKGIFNRCDYAYLYH